MASTDAKLIPIKNQAYRLTFVSQNAALGFVTNGTGMDTEVSKDGATFADATNEATEIGSTGIYFIDLTTAEMNADIVVIKTTFTNLTALPAATVLYPVVSTNILAND